MIYIFNLCLSINFYLLKFYLTKALFKIAIFNYLENKILKIVENFKLFSNNNIKLIIYYFKSI